MKQKHHLNPLFKKKRSASEIFVHSFILDGCWPVAKLGYQHSVLALAVSKYGAIIAENVSYTFSKNVS